MPWCDTGGTAEQGDATLVEVAPHRAPDADVFTIDAMAGTPAAVGGGAYSGVGTVIFNMVVNPVNGHVYVANTEATPPAHGWPHAAPPDADPG